MELLLVGIGGAFGSLTRYGLGKLIKFPIATFVINVSGAFLLGFVNSVGLKNNICLIIADGFLGAYTTFSTFMFEGAGLFKENKRAKAVKYLAGTLLLGIIGFMLGIKLGKS